MLANLGLILIIIGWVIQLMSRDKKIQPYFVLTYGFGVLLLVIDNYAIGLNSMAFLNLVSVVLAGLVYFHIKK